MIWGLHLTVGLVPELRKKAKVHALAPLSMGDHSFPLSMGLRAPFRGAFRVRRGVRFGKLFRFPSVESFPFWRTFRSCSRFLPFAVSPSQGEVAGEVCLLVFSRSSPLRILVICLSFKHLRTYFILQSSVFGTCFFPLARKKSGRHFCLARAKIMH